MATGRRDTELRFANWREMTTEQQKGKKLTKKDGKKGVRRKTGPAAAQIVMSAAVKS